MAAAASAPVRALSFTSEPANALVRAKNGKSFTVKALNGNLDHKDGIVNFIVHGNKPIGAGHFSQVFKGTVEGHHSPRVLKKIHTDRHLSWQVGNIREDNMPEEYETLLELRGVPHCAQIRGALLESFHCHTVFDLLPKKNLFQFAHKHLISTPMIQSIVYQALLGLKEVHQRKLIYCDFKPDNLMFDPSSGHIMLIDFGLTLKVLEGQEQLSGSLVGTLSYMAPEILIGLPFSFDSDLVGFGITLFEIYTDRKENSLLEFDSRNSYFQKRLKTPMYVHSFKSICQFLVLLPFLG